MALEPITTTPPLSTPPLFGRPPSSADHRSVLKAAGVMGLLTLASRIFGFARDVLIAAAYGTSTTAQAFVVAFRIPNLLRDMAGEGAANAAFVPVFTKTRTQEGQRSWMDLAQAVWIRMLLGFAAISLLGIFAAPFLVRLVAPGFVGDPTLFALTVSLTRILFPFIGLVGLAAFFMGLLNSVQRFAAPALGPVLLNICMIAGIFLYRPDALGLCWGVIAGGILQLAIQWPALRRSGIHLGLGWKNHPGVSEIQRLLGPRVIGTGVYQLSVAVDTIFASFGHLVGAGGVASLYFAHRFLHLPLALFGISMAQAALPTLAAQVAAQDTQATRATCLMGLRSSLLIAIPSSVGLIFLALPIIRTLLERGEFSFDSSIVTARVLQAYALGLASLCAVKVLANTLYAFGDTWTPVRSATIALALNVLLNLLLIWPLGLVGLALATSLSSTWNMFHLYRAVCRRVGSITQELKGWTLRVLAASLGMGWASFLLWQQTQNLSGLFLAILLGVAAFFVFAFLLHIEETHRLVQWLRRSA